MEKNEMIEELLSAAKSAKEATEQVKKSHEELDGRVKKIHDEMEAGKQADTASKTAFQEAVVRVEKAENALETVNKALADLQMKAERRAGAKEVKTLGQLVQEADIAKSYRGGNVTLLEIEGEAVKKALSSGADSAGVLIQPYRAPIVLTPDAPTTVRDLFPSVSISTNAIEWVREKLFTNNAAVQATEGAAKAESNLVFELMNSAVATIAHWIPASRQVLSDAPQLRGLIDTKLRSGLKLKEDEELLYGDGTNGSLLGLVPQATPYSSTGIPANPTAIDHIRWAILQVAKALYPATFAVLSLDDWAKIQMTKTTDGAYVFGTPSDGAAPRLWGKRVVESYSLPANEFVVGSSYAATIYDREQVTVRVAEQHADLFVKNMLAILCEERLGFTVERPAAIVHGEFVASGG